MAQPTDLQTQLNTVQWTNGQRQITGAYVLGLFTLLLSILGGMGTWTNGVFSPNTTGLASGLASALVPHVANNAALQGYTLYLFPVVRDGFYTPGDGGGATYAHSSTACSQADNGLQVKAPDGGCWTAALSSSASLRLWGAKGDGVTDDSTAVRAALAVPNLEITDPAGGTYSVTCSGGSFTFGTDTTFSGSGRQNTMFRVQSSNCPVFILGGYYNAMRHFAIQAYTGQVAGSVYITMSGNQNVVEDYAMTSDYTAVLMTGSTEVLGGGNLHSPSPGAVRVRVEGGDDSDLIDGLIEGADQNTGANAPAAGIRVRNSSALTISNTSVLSQNNCLVVDPYQAATSTTATDAGPVFDITVHDSLFDTCTNGVVIAPSGTGSVLRTRFVNSWSSSASVNGFSVNNTGSGSVKGLYLVNHHAVANVNGSGFATAGAGITDVQIIGGAYAGNAIGTNFGGTVNGIGVHDASIGTAMDIVANITGIFLAANDNNIDISGNLITGNTTQIADGTASAAAKIIVDNVGYNPIPRTSGSCSASPCVIGNTTGAPLQVIFSNSGGSVTAVTEDGVSLPTASADVVLPQGSYVSVAFAGGTVSYSQKGL